MIDNMTPITLRDLLSRDDYKDYFRRAPVPFPSSTPPWAVVAISREGKYGKVHRDDFKSAFSTAKKILQRDDIHDVSIFCKNRISIVPSFADEIMTPAEDWCGRCRRPSIFKRYGTRHPALRDAPVIVADQRRCYFCGISYAFLSQGFAA
ncbi:hypothetical protein PP997_gp60 [Gordonia phage BigChungus]|uniref:Uncharacterized protein n=2 Tax=Ponsvirus TaxID=3044795 RepID=A0AAE8BVB4_9CAUD|nr:hypothetical protein PP997_gp60 [Gordonia phage BigChungus]YP_010663480.1 hypothetical protein PP998_gp63 [Gordonia phage Vine]QNJ59560.1 hypothetical protein SEA_BIGCHUNGUS_60 [Gordonia phage BigChungus]QZD97772.1 hypothetical protein SEA_VINE_63 [Gordonia phage Vine]WNN94195.1 hypothetical protein SEA_ELINAL_65 [Gordonia phage Elinal]